METSSSWICFAAVIVSLCANTSCLVCLSCDGISQPRHCHQVEECSAGQICGVERYLDHFNDVYYNLRCLDNKHCSAQNNSIAAGHVSCTECCHGDLCNANGCGNPGFPVEIGPICYNCATLAKGRACHNIDICDTDEVCFVSETEEFGDMLVDSGCRNKHTCHTNQGVDPNSIIGKRANERSISHTACNSCCDGNLCNTGCANSTSQGCQNTEFRCASGQCIPATNHCDGSPQCSDHSDETNCTSSNPCGPGKFVCRSSHQCIDGELRCDGHVDCSDRSDEMNCSCTPSQFRCASGQCVAGHYRCDGSSQCLDESDETNCTKPFIPRDCLDIHLHDADAPSGVYKVTPLNVSTFLVWCDMDKDGGGWTVFQRRFNGSVDFYKTFAVYQKGFGNLNGGEFWLGLDHIHQLTTGHNNKLKVEVREYNGTVMYDTVPVFGVGPGPQYILTAKDPTGHTASRQIPYLNGAPFSTYDHERDTYRNGNCAQMYHGALWYKDCFALANPNGNYNPGEYSRGGGHGLMTYYTHRGLLTIEMKFRRTL